MLRIIQSEDDCPRYAGLDMIAAMSRDAKILLMVLLCIADVQEAAHEGKSLPQTARRGTQGKQNGGLNTV